MLKFVGINDNPDFKIHGRSVKKADPLPLFWNHSGVEVNCDGSELWIDIEVDNGFFEPWIAVEINGCLMQRRMLLHEDKSVCLFRSMTPGVVKNVRFYRELQAMHEDDNCHVLVKGFRTDGEFSPVKESKLKLEFIGDSITSGEGTYGATTDTDWIPMYMSSSRHYATIIEKAMEADVRIISQGGFGVYIGWDNDLRHKVPDVYEPVCGLAFGKFNESIGAREKNDFEDWKPDAIIVNLGTNDTTAFSTPPLDVPGYGICKMHRDENGGFNKDDIKKVTDAIYAFLKVLRDCNPESHIVWAFGMLGDELSPYIINTIAEYKENEKDDNVAFLALPNTTEETYGAHMHPGYKAHQAAAAVLGQYLSNKFNIEYKEKQGNL